MDSQVAVSNGATAFGACTTVVCAFVNWLASNPNHTAIVFGLVGIVIGLLGLFFNAFFQWRRDQREREEYNYRKYNRRHTDS